MEFIGTLHETGHMEYPEKCVDGSRFMPPPLTVHYINSRQFVVVPVGYNWQQLEQDVLNACNADGKALGWIAEAESAALPEKDVASTADNAPVMDVETESAALPEKDAEAAVHPEAQPKKRKGS